MNLWPLVDLLTRRFFMRAYRVTILGGEHIPPHGPAILAANHESILDPWFVAVCTPRQVHYLAKAELFRYPGLRAILNGLGCVPVVRGSDGGVAIDHAERLLREGKLVGVFPQGTCLPHRPRPFRRGAARLALATGAPLIPLALIGTERALHPGTHRIGFPKVTIAVGKPLHVESHTPSKPSAAELTSRLEATVAALYAPYGDPQHAWSDHTGPSTGSLDREDQTDLSPLNQDDRIADSSSDA